MGSPKIKVILLGCAPSSFGIMSWNHRSITQIHNSRMLTPTMLYILLVSAIHYFEHDSCVSYSLVPPPFFFFYFPTRKKNQIYFFFPPPPPPPPPPKKKKGEWPQKNKKKTTKKQNLRIRVWYQYVCYLESTQYQPRPHTYFTSKEEGLAGINRWCMR